MAVLESKLEIRICNYDILISPEFGRGSSGVILKAVNAENRSKCVVKKIDFTSDISRSKRFLSLK